MSYNAIVLTQDSQNELLKYFSNIIPDESGWTIKAHHVTISMGSTPNEYYSYLNQTIPLTVYGFGKNDRVIAAQVEINHEVVQSKNKIPHITLAINNAVNAKPKESNDIENWQKINQNFTINGIFKELK